MRILYHSEAAYSHGREAERPAYSRIIGILHDKDYLFLCAWQTETGLEIYSFEQSLSAVDPDTKDEYLRRDGGHLVVNAYRMRTGKPVSNVELAPHGEQMSSWFPWPDLGKQLTAANLESKLPKAVPDETTEAGPLRLINGVLDCYGIAIGYKDYIAREGAYAAKRPQFGVPPKTSATPREYRWCRWDAVRSVFRPGVPTIFTALWADYGQSRGTVPNPPPRR